MKKDNFRTFVIIVVLFALKIDYAQSQEISMKMIILDAKTSGVNISEWHLERNQFLAIYTNSDDEVCFANVSAINDDQSFGEIFALEVEEAAETDSTYQGKDFSFSWKYSNTYDSKEGTAKIKIHLLYKPQGVVFHCNMMLENPDVYEYTGYIEGTLDTSKPSN
jgi:hypothetical protein